MAFKIVKGDMLMVKPQSGRETILAHGVNCQGVMGSGIAKSIKDRFPYAEERYKHLVERAGGRKGELLGRTQLIMIKEFDSLDDKTSIFAIANMFTQLKTGADARYDAIDAALGNLAIQVLRKIPTDIYFPQIGCGIGGLEWDKVLPMLQFFHDTLEEEAQCNVYVVEEYVKGIHPE